MSGMHSYRVGERTYGERSVGMDAEMGAFCRRIAGPQPSLLQCLACGRCHPVPYRGVDATDEEDVIEGFGLEACTASTSSWKSLALALLLKSPDS